MNELYEMKLHDTLCPAGESYTLIMRVPGGWVYTFWDDKGAAVSSTFVPWNYQFLAIEED